MKKPELREVAIVWSGNPEGGVAARDRLRLQGWIARVFDAHEFHRSPQPVPCHLLAFVGAHNEFEILAAYDAAGLKPSVVRFGADGSAVDVPPNAIAPSIITQPDALKAKLEAMDEAALRAFAVEVKVDLPSGTTPETEMRELIELGVALQLESTDGDHTSR